MYLILIMNNRIILSLYRAKLRICNSYGYSYGDWMYINPKLNFGKVLLKIKKSRSYSSKAKYIANYTRFFYKDAKNIKDKELIDYNIDEAFRAFRRYHEYF